MSTGFLSSLAVTVAAILGARFLFAALPLRSVAVPMTAVDAVLSLVGTAGLLLHCSAMFFQSAVSTLPGADSLIGQIVGMGTSSIIWYVGPAALLLLGLRRQHPIMLAVVALALTAVGITMYDNGSLQTHLAAIFALVVVLAGLVATAVVSPWRRGSAAVRPSV